MALLRRYLFELRAADAARAANSSAPGATGALPPCPIKVPTGKPSLPEKPSALCSAGLALNKLRSDRRGL